CMPSHCCVPLCSQQGYRLSNGEKVSYFNFPKDKTARIQWIHAIRRDEGNYFKIHDKTKVCSLHFKPDVLKKSLNGRIFVKEGNITSKFEWKLGSPKKRKAPTARQPLVKNTTCNNVPSTSSHTDFTVRKVNDNEELLKEEVTDLKRVQEEESVQNSGHMKKQIENLKKQSEIIEPLTHGENIRYVREKPNDFYVAIDDGEPEKENDERKKGRPKKLKPIEEYFMVLCRLRRGFSIQHLSHLFGVASSSVSRSLTAWISFMYLKFGQINLWPSKQLVQDIMPDVFKEKYPNTRVIIDCTEIRCEMPGSLLLNGELFSSYKNHTTLKGLIGIAPSGAITFISQLYTGSISDREIVIRSGFLDQAFVDGDTVMADKGFTIQDLLPLGTTLNIPPFL
ncbi:THAP domain-containing 6, partial [Paramuricea clavata]